MSTTVQTHPLYANFLPLWEKMIHAYDGEDTIKDNGKTYLPATAGQIRNGAGGNALESEGEKSYSAYKSRARFPEWFEEAVDNALGLMHRKPAKIELPEKLKYLLDSATIDGEGLQGLLRQINKMQLKIGRGGIMLDLPAVEQTQPRLYFAIYDGTKILNWDDGTRDGNVQQKLNMVLLKETEQERVAGLAYKEVNKYRLLSLGDVETVNGNGDYAVAVMRNTVNPAAASFIEPTVRGKKLQQIPFVFFNKTDGLTAPDKPPLLKLVNHALANYRLSADYYQALFMQGQDTFVVSGDDSDEETGEGTLYHLGAEGGVSLQTGAKAEFVGVNSEGLPEMRRAMEADETKADTMGRQLLAAISRERESGDALGKRISSQTTTLTQLAITGAASLERLLKIAAEWVGANPDEVKVEANMDFSNEKLSGQTLVEVMTAINLGLPLSYESVHQYLKERDITKKSFDEEIERINEEANQGIGFSTEIDEEV